MAARKADFVARDHELEAAHDKTTEKLAAHRWHWTLDESNPERLSIREYARRIGRNESSVRIMVTGYANWRVRASDARRPMPGEPITLREFMERERMPAELAEAAEAVAAATGKTYGSVAHPTQRREVLATYEIARERAARHGTTVTDEVAEVAKKREQFRQSERKQKEQRAKKTSHRFLSIEDKVGKATRALREALAEAEGVEWEDDERELLTEALARCRAVLTLLDMRIAGEVDVDWDAELEKLRRDAA